MPSAGHCASSEALKVMFPLDFPVHSCAGSWSIWLDICFFFLCHRFGSSFVVEHLINWKQFHQNSRPFHQAGIVTMGELKQVISTVGECLECIFALFGLSFTTCCLICTFLDFLLMMKSWWLLLFSLKHTFFRRSLTNLWPLLGE